MDGGTHILHLDVTPCAEACTETRARHLEREEYTELAVLDLDWLRVQLGCDEDTVRQLLELYRSRGAELVAAMSLALAAGDAAALRFHAHALKGISGTIGAQRMHALLQDDASSLGTAFSRIEVAFVDVRAAIDEQLAE